MDDLHNKILDVVLESDVSNIERNMQFYRKLSSSILRKRSIFENKWRLFKNFEHFLALRVLIGYDLVIYPNRNLGEEIVTEIIKINEMTYSAMDGRKCLVFYSKDDFRVENVGIIDTNKFREVLHSIRPLKYNEANGVSNYDERIEEILWTNNSKIETKEIGNKSREKTKKNANFKLELTNKKQENKISTVNEESTDESVCITRRVSLYRKPSKF